MLLYIIETLVLLLWAIAWLSSQGLFFCTHKIDAVLFYTQFLSCFGVLLMHAFTAESSKVEIKRSLRSTCFSLNLGIFLLYAHLIDSAFNYNAMPPKKSMQCTNHPHSDAYRILFFCEYPREMTLVFGAITLAFTIMVMFASAAFNMNDLWANTWWTDYTLLLMASIHCYAALFDATTITSAFMYFSVFVHFTVLFWYGVLYGVSNERCFMNLKITTHIITFLLELLHFCSLVLLALSLFLFQYEHTSKHVVWSFVVIVLFMMLFILINKVAILRTFWQHRQQNLTTAAVAASSASNTTAAAQTLAQHHQQQQMQFQHLSSSQSTIIPHHFQHQQMNTSFLKKD